ncbi:NAD-dependent epimerase/dehydratase family protein [Haloglomus litoreum]|uniref:NAD-dependent epimerase/dehydratase family protein n=1 Tax=Haloglomus litoreum TaxID=3034026 RepID=UPI0023E82D25|nr:NAD-dependent epimerase/dehydratase family protein [Haloglomus sp. DT116]
MSGHQSPVTDSRVLVTGGAGFVGSHLAAALLPENEVRVLDDCSTGTAEAVPAEATLFEGDVADPEAVAEAMAGVDLVFHQAAMVSVPRSVEAPVACHRTNATGSLQVLDRARYEDARVVLASSAAVYGEPAAVPVTETEPLVPESPYGVSKLAAEAYARTYADRYGLETVALRYFNIYGPGQAASDYSNVITTFLRRARAGRPLAIHGDGGQTRDFVHVDDVVRANLAAATADGDAVAGTPINIGTGRSVTIRELAEQILSVTGSDSDIVHTDAREGDVEDSRAAIDRARQLLGYEPTVDLESGLGTLVDGGTRR